MSILKKPVIGINRKQIPFGVKFALFLAVIFGLWLRSCWTDYQKESIIFSNVRLENPTPVSVDVRFTIENKSVKQGKHKIYIQVFTSKNEVIAKKLTFIEFTAKSTKGYIKVIDKFQRPLDPDETLFYAKVELD